MTATSGCPNKHRKSPPRKHAISPGSVEQNAQLLQNLLVLGGDLVPRVLEARHTQVVQPAQNGQQRVEVLALLADVRHLNEVLDDLGPLHRTRLAQDLVHHPEHLLVGQVRELAQPLEAELGRLLEQEVDVLGGLDRLEEAVVAQRELGGQFQRVQLNGVINKE